MKNFAQLRDLKHALIRDYEALVPVAAGLTGSSEDEAREAFHLVVCRLLEGLRNHPLGNAVVAWRPYLLQCVANALRETARTIGRRKKTVVLFGELDEEGHRQVSELTDPQRPPLEQAERNELAALVWKELEKLPPRQQDVIAQYCKGCRFREIAVVLEIDPATARAHFHKGIKKLRHRLQKAA